MPGLNSNMFATGSRGMININLDGLIRYFHTNKTEFVHQVKTYGCQNTVSVSWNPSNARRMASAADEGWVYIWEAIPVF